MKIILMKWKYSSNENESEEILWRNDIIYLILMKISIYSERNDESNEEAEEGKQ